MNPRKAELRKIILDIVTGRESAMYGNRRINSILSGVAEVLERRSGKPGDPHNVFPREVELDHADKLLAQEVIWDLIIERVLTPGADSANFELPWLRLHSEANDRLG